MSGTHGPSSPTNKSDHLVIGPALPLHLVKKSHDHSSGSSSSSQDNEQEGASSVIGPALPPHLSKKPHSHNSSTSNSDNEQEAVSTNIGPTLPQQELKPTKEVNDKAEKALKSSESALDLKSLLNASIETYGPILPPHLQKTSTVDDSDDDDSYGPLPTGAPSNSMAHQALEERALQIKLGQLDPKKDDAKVREEWMLELPEVGARNLGLGPRQFRKNPKPDFSDRSSWTDTPEEKAKKVHGKTEARVDLKQVAELEAINKRDEEQAKMAEKHSRKKKHNPSLVEMHQEKLKKKKKQEEDEGGPTRRPFNREIDLKVNQFDDAQKKSIMKKAMHLDDRFSSGQSKFL